MNNNEYLIKKYFKFIVYKTTFTSFLYICTKCILLIT